MVDRKESGTNFGHLEFDRESLKRVDAGPCRTEFSDVGFDFIVVGTNKILSFDELNSAEP